VTGYASSAKPPEKSTINDVVEKREMRCFVLGKKVGDSRGHVKD